MSTTVGDSTGYAPNLQMSAFGYVIAAGMIVILLPVLPLIVLVWILWRLFVADEPVEPRYKPWRDERATTRASSEDTEDETEAGGDEGESDDPAGETEDDDSTNS